MQGRVGAKLARGDKPPLSSEDVHVLKILGEALDKFRLGAAFNEGTDTQYGGPFWRMKTVQSKGAGSQKLP